MKIAVIGVGTIIYKDEGVGVYVLKYIKKNYTFNKKITLIDGGVLGFNLMSYYQEYDKVIIIDTITMDDEAGAIYNIPSEKLLGLGSYKQTAHEVEIVEMLEICSLLDKMAEVTIIGIVPKDIVSVEVGLSIQIRNKFNELKQEALKELSKSGVIYKKNKKEFTLDQIIYEYSYPVGPKKSSI